MNATYCCVINYAVPFISHVLEEARCTACREANKCYCSGEN